MKYVDAILSWYWARKNRFQLRKDIKTCYKFTTIGYLPDGRKVLYHTTKRGLLGHPAYTNKKEYALDWLNLTMEE